MAYVIYTSGTSGRPKGVMIEHKSVVELCYWHRLAFSLSTDSRASVYASIGFDAFGWEVWPYLLSGGSLFPIPQAERLQIIELADWFKRQQISHSFLPTPICKQVVQTGLLAEQDKLLVLTGGEEWGSVRGINRQVINNYGPTESTVVTTSASLQEVESGKATIGKPIANRKVYVLDESLQPQPVGIVGEILIGGTGLARGYLHQEDLTEEKFISNPFGEGRLYKTGDLGYWNRDGALEYLGR
ncbi:AMP-binding protein, partial [Fulvivirgaceae bacterium BMA12]|nr:AMP-binding protein [Fulvivirgaceae bacterium BMA12]